jgi:hypothetical protein
LTVAGVLVRALTTVAIWIVEGGYLLILAFNSFGSSGEYGILTGEQVKARFFASVIAAVILTTLVWVIRVRKR